MRDFGFIKNTFLGGASQAATLTMVRLYNAFAFLAVSNEDQGPSIL